MEDAELSAMWWKQEAEDAEQELAQLQQENARLKKIEQAASALCDADQTTLLFWERFKALERLIRSPRTNTLDGGKEHNEHDQD